MSFLKPTRQHGPGTGSRFPRRRLRQSFARLLRCASPLTSGRSAASSAFPCPAHLESLEARNLFSISLVKGQFTLVESSSGARALGVVFVDNNTSSSATVTVTTANGSGSPDLVTGLTVDFGGATTGAQSVNIVSSVPINGPIVFTNYGSSVSITSNILIDSIVNPGSSSFTSATAGNNAALTASNYRADPNYTGAAVTSALNANNFPVVGGANITGSTTFTGNSGAVNLNLLAYSSTSATLGTVVFPNALSLSNSGINLTFRGKANVSFNNLTLPNNAQVSIATQANSSLGNLTFGNVTVTTSSSSAGVAITPNGSGTIGAISFGTIDFQGSQGAGLLVTSTRFDSFSSAAILNSSTGSNAVTLNGTGTFGNVSLGDISSTATGSLAVNLNLSGTVSSVVTGNIYFANSTTGTLTLTNSSSIGSLVIASLTVAQQAAGTVSAESSVGNISGGISIPGGITFSTSNAANLKFINSGSIGPVTFGPISIPGSPAGPVNFGTPINVAPAGPIGSVSLGNIVTGTAGAVGPSTLNFASSSAITGFSTGTISLLNSPGVALNVTSPNTPSVSFGALSIVSSTLSLSLSPPAGVAGNSPTVTSFSSITIGSGTATGALTVNVIGDSVGTVTATGTWAVNGTLNFSMLARTGSVAAFSAPGLRISSVATGQVNIGLSATDSVGPVTLQSSDLIAGFDANLNRIIGAVNLTVSADSDVNGSGSFAGLTVLSQGLDSPTVAPGTNDYAQQVFSTLNISAVKVGPISLAGGVANTSIVARNTSNVAGGGTIDQIDLGTASGLTPVPNSVSGTIVLSADNGIAGVTVRGTNSILNELQAVANNGPSGAGDIGPITISGAPGVISIAGSIRAARIAPITVDQGNASFETLAILTNSVPSTTRAATTNNAIGNVTVLNGNLDITAIVSDDGVGTLSASSTNPASGNITISSLTTDNDAAVPQPFPTALGGGIAGIAATGNVFIGSLDTNALDTFTRTPSESVGPISAGGSVIIDVIDVGGDVGPISAGVSVSLSGSASVEVPQGFTQTVAGSITSINLTGSQTVPHSISLGNAVLNLRVGGNLGPVTGTGGSLDLISLNRLDVSGSAGWINAGPSPVRANLRVRSLTQASGGPALRITGSSRDYLLDIRGASTLSVDATLAIDTASSSNNLTINDLYGSSSTTTSLTIATRNAYSNNVLKDYSSSLGTDDSNASFNLLSLSDPRNALDPNPHDLGVLRIEGSLLGPIGFDSNRTDGTAATFSANEPLLGNITTLDILGTWDALNRIFVTGLGSLSYANIINGDPSSPTGYSFETPVTGYYSGSARSGGNVSAIPSLEIYTAARPTFDYVLSPSLSTPTSFGFTRVYRPGPGRSLSLSSISAANVAVTAPGSISLVTAVSTTSLVNEPGVGVVASVTYSASLASGGSPPQGLYQISNGSSPVVDNLTEATANLTTTAIGGYSPPAASLAVPLSLPRGDTSSFTFSVSYQSASNDTLDTISFTGANVAVSIFLLGDSTPLTSSLLSFTNTGSGSPGSQILATYSASLPSGTFASRTGTLEVSIGPSPVRTRAAQFSATNALLGSVALQYTNPSAFAPPLTAPTFNASSLSFTVVYRPAAGRTIDLLTLGNNNVQLVGPGSASLAIALTGQTISASDVTASYSASLPSGSPLRTLGPGTLTLSTGTSPVRDDVASPVLPGTLASLNDAFTPPSATLSSPPTLPPRNANSLSFIVTYSAPPTVGDSVDPSSIAPGNISALLSTTTLNLAVSNVNPSLNQIAVTYTATLPSGTFATQTGPLSLSIGNVPVRSSLQFPVSPATLGSLNIVYPNPTASVIALPVPRYTDTVLAFTVVYRPGTNQAINLASLSSNNIAVTGPGTSSLTTSLVAQQVNGNNVTASYSASLPSGDPLRTLGQGTFTLSTGSSPVLDDLASPVLPGTLSSVAAALTPPSASLIPPAVPIASASQFTFQVSYTAANGFQLTSSSIATGNITVTTPSGTSLTPTLLSSVPESPTSSFTATYSLALSNSVFSASTGTYSFDLGSVPVTDDLGNPTLATTGGALGSLLVSYAAPTASLLPLPIDRPLFTDTALIFSVRYVTAPGRTIQPSQFGNDDLSILLPGSTNTVTASLVSLANVDTLPNSPTSSYQATYSFALLGSGNAAIGAYTVRVNPNSVLDDLAIAVPTGSIGTYTVAFTPPPASALPPASPSSGTSSVSFSVTYTASSPSSIASSSLGDDDITITLPGNTTTTAHYTGLFTVNANTLTALYSFTTPSGVFNQSTDGTYAASLNPNSVLDSRGVPATAGQLFSSQLITTPAVSPNLLSLSAPTGSFLPGTPVFPAASLANPSPLVPTFPFTLRYKITVANQTLTLGDVTANPISPSASLTLQPPAGLALPASALLPPGQYTLSATLLDASGNELPTTTVSSPTSITVIAPPVTPTNGGIDTTFGGGSGVVTNFVPEVSFTIVGSVPIPNSSSILSAGYTADGQFILLRLRPDGSLDSSFGNSGRLTFRSLPLPPPPAAAPSDFASVFRTDASGRLILAGVTTLPDNSQRLTLLRFSLDNSGTPNLDNSFGTGGISSIPVSNTSDLSLGSITFDSAGNLYLAGAFTSSTTTRSGFVARLNSFGQLDSLFGADGFISAGTSGGSSGILSSISEPNTTFTTVQVLASRILIGGYASNADGSVSRFLVVSLKTNGTLDTTFAGRGRGIYLSSPNSTLDRITTLYLTPQNQIYAGGTRAAPSFATSQAVLFRLTSRGAPDPGFNRARLLTLPTSASLASVTSITPSASNSILVSVATASSNAQAQQGRFGAILFRITSAGLNDRTFNNGSPLTLLASNPVPAAATSAAAEGLDNLVESVTGALTRTSTGATRSVNSVPNSSSNTTGTTVSVTAISVGPNLASALTGKLPATAKPGSRSRLTLQISNSGDPAAGSLTVLLLATPTSGNATQLLSTTYRVSIPNGIRRNYALSFQLFSNLPLTSYTLSAQLTNLTGFTDVDPSNNNSSFATPITLTATGKQS